MKPKQQAMMKLAIERLPKAEFMQIFELAGCTNPSASDIETRRAQVVFNRYANRCCNLCLGGAKEYKKLLLCTHCYATWYCNAECQQKDWEAHKRWCNRPDAKPDTGPLRVTVIDVRKKTADEAAEMKEIQDLILAALPESRDLKVWNSRTGKWRTLRKSS